MYTLERLNVVKLAENEADRDRYIAQGYKLIGGVKKAIKEPIEVNYNDMEYSKLVALAKSKGLKGNMKKDDIIAALSEMR